MIQGQAIIKVHHDPKLFPRGPYIASVVLEQLYRPDHILQQRHQDDNDRDIELAKKELARWCKKHGWMLSQSSILQ